jgi:hypothetical protein
MIMYRPETECAQSISPLSRMTQVPRFVHSSGSILTSLRPTLLAILRSFSIAVLLLLGKEVQSTQAALPFMFSPDLNIMTENNGKEIIIIPFSISESANTDTNNAAVLAVNNEGPNFNSDKARLAVIMQVYTDLLATKVDNYTISGIGKSVSHSVKSDNSTHNILISNFASSSHTDLCSLKSDHYKGAVEICATSALTSYIYLPLLFKGLESQICHYYDDFSNASSGWPTLNNENATLSYSNGEYHIFNKVPELRIVQAPADSFQQYKVEVTARWLDYVG